ncbi:eCIS core domain-containing protein [Phocaeicola sp.]
MKAEKVHQERVARTIQQMHNGTAQFMDNRPLMTVQRMQEQAVQRVGLDEEEDAVQGKFTDAVQRAPEDEEEPLQGKFAGAIQREEEDEMQMKSEPAIQQKPNNTGLPDNLKAGVESLSGYSMDDVKVHYNSSQPATVQALAYTQGTDIHVAPGQEQHLPHEAWHVAQQMAGRVEPTTEIGGMPVNDNAGLEHEADVMGAKANSL